MPDQVTYTLRMPESGDYTYNAQTAVIDPNTYLWKRAPEDYCRGIVIWLKEFHISLCLDTTTTANYTGQFLGVQFFVDLSIIQYATSTVQDPSSVNLSFYSI